MTEPIPMPNPSLGISMAVHSLRHLLTKLHPVAPACFMLARTHDTRTPTSHTCSPSNPPVHLLFLPKRVQAPAQAFSDNETRKASPCSMPTWGFTFYAYKRLWRIKKRVGNSRLKEEEKGASWFWEKELFFFSLFFYLREDSWALKKGVCVFGKADCEEGKVSVKGLLCAILIILRVSSFVFSYCKEKW